MMNRMASGIIGSDRARSYIRAVRNALVERGSGRVQRGFGLGLGQGPTALVLADLSSLAPKVDTPYDVVDGLALIRELVERTLIPPRGVREIVDVELRIYGGFFAVDGSATQHLSFLRRAIPLVEGLRNGVRLRPTAAVSLACRPGARIVGTYRGGRQRMVDQMLAQDARFSCSRYDLLGIIADDEDYFPAILALSTETPVPIRWLRQRPTGRNDAHLEGTKVTTLQDSAWQTRR
jgi:hypothetical protein